MRVLIACEFSGIVREAFHKKGHDSWSCDLLPTEIEGNHYQGDIFDILYDNWDLVIAHPPCTYLSLMGIWWNAKRPERWEETFKALEFVKKIWSAPVEKMSLENPIGYLNNHWMKPTQIIHPWQFGQEFFKATCLWTRNLPLLVPTKIVDRGEYYINKNGIKVAKWSHTTTGRLKEKRAKIASRTFEGIANAMADQWSNT